MGSSKILIFSIFTFLCCSFAAENIPMASYNVLDFGAQSDGKSDCTESFLNAWEAACATIEPATIYVPHGSYLLGNAIFKGKSCSNMGITILINATILATNDYEVIGNSETWLKFERVNGVSIQGGTLDGQGTTLWDCKKFVKDCPQGAKTLGFYNSNNITINGLSSLNSQKVHIEIYGCNNATLNSMNISAAGNSPNTDGIHVQKSSAITILNSNIGTGDDCVSIGPGTSDLWVENVSCGPGHGISIGSLGQNSTEAGVQNVTVKNATFTETQNGLRVKTWARRSTGFVRDVYFEHIFMINSKNPIIIDQHYCPDHILCPTEGLGVRIINVTYEDVHGTSATQVAVKFDCSQTNPCTGIFLNGVNITYRDKSATSSSCANARGTAFGTIAPISCLT